MGVEFRILGSSSKGNAALLSTGETSILIDAGFSGKRIQERLKAVGSSIEAIDAVFITHEHSDHSIGVRGLSRNKKDIEFYANADTANEVQSRLARPVNRRIFDTGSTFVFKDIEVSTFSIPHDAVDPVGFIIRSIPKTGWPPQPTGLKVRTASNAPGARPD